MPQLEREDLIVQTEQGGIDLCDGGEGLFINLDTARWLLATSLPAMINALTGTEEVSVAVREGYLGVREG